LETIHPSAIETSFVCPDTPVTVLLATKQFHKHQILPTLRLFAIIHPSPTEIEPLARLLLEIMDELLTVIFPTVHLLILIGTLLFTLTRSAFSIMHPEPVNSFQPLLTGVKVICPPLREILSVSVPFAIRVPFT